MKADIQAFAKNWDLSFNAGDMAKLAGLYAADASVVPAGGAPVKARDAIGTFFADVRSKGLTEHRIVVQSLIERGDTVVAVGTWNLSGTGDDGESLKFGGNWVNVLGRDGNTWKILLHIWN